MSLKLSHTGLTNYQTCPMKYKYRYEDRIVSKYKSAALYFGSALDQAINSFFLPDTQESPQAIFDKYWGQGADQTGAQISLPDDINVVYAAADFDKDLYQTSDWAAIYQKIKQLGLQGNPIQLFQEIKSKKSEIGLINLPPNEIQLYNFMNWLCLRRKGYLMIDAYQQKILPKIKEVIAVQKYIEAPITENSTLRGYVDLIVRWEDDSIVVIDNKTSSINYEPDSAQKSQQLALYQSVLNKENYNIQKAGFIVLKKGIRKNIQKTCTACNFQADKGSTHKTCYNVIDAARCSGEWEKVVEFDIDIQIIIDEIPQSTQDMILANVHTIQHAIHQKIWPQNLNSCKQPWGPCEYYQKCWFNNESEIIKLPPPEGE